MLKFFAAGLLVYDLLTSFKATCFKHVSEDTNKGSPFRQTIVSVKEVQIAQDDVLSVVKMICDAILLFITE